MCRLRHLSRPLIRRDNLPLFIGGRGAPIGAAVTQAVLMEDGATAANAMDVSGHVDAGSRADGAKGPEPPA